jgi:hypothetical protein
MSDGSDKAVDKIQHDDQIPEVAPEVDTQTPNTQDDKTMGTEEPADGDTLEEAINDSDKRATESIEPTTLEETPEAPKDAAPPDSPKAAVQDMEEVVDPKDESGAEEELGKFLRSCISIKTKDDR